MYTTTPFGYLIDNTFLFTDIPQDNAINLAVTKWPAMRYDNSVVKLVDFPGEYDIDGHTIVCFDAWGYLHYQIITEKWVIVLMQDTALLEKETLADVDIWLCTNQKAKDAIERDELEGEVIVMEGYEGWFTQEA
jgi:hypothetical protein